VLAGIRFEGSKGEKQPSHGSVFVVLYFVYNLILVVYSTLFTPI